ncbi:MAG: DedA family protein, partial [Burkholderiales bacterium]
MESHLQTLVGYFSAHPHIALAAVLAAALLEALPFIGTVVPGSSVVFVGGVLIGLQAIDPWWTGAAAVAGAIVGDGTSYWLGHRYHEQIRALWPMRNHPELLERGQAYFARNGGKSVFIARFLGPLRAIVPVVADMSNMPAPQFYVMNALSALGWAAAHLLPGALFGASLQLAGAVSSRLVIMLIALVAAIWVIAKLVRVAIVRGWPRLRLLRERLVRWAHAKPGWLARIVLSLFDPARPESGSLLMGAVVLIGSGWLFLAVLQDVISNDPLVQFDQTVYR